MPESPEQKARREIDAQLVASGWVVQDKNTIDFNAGPGIAIREYPTDIGPADYALFVDKTACGVVEAKKRRPATTSRRSKTKPPVTGAPSSNGSIAQGFNLGRKRPIASKSRRDG